jgi:hypothetical protein
MPENWPSTSWNTEIIVQDTGEYRDGLVSKVDARGLSEALSRVMRNEGAALGVEVYSAMSKFIIFLGESAFLATEQVTGRVAMFAR